MRDDTGAYLAEADAERREGPECLRSHHREDSRPDASLGREISYEWSLQFGSWEGREVRSRLVRTQAL